jgi:hypothetical protein
MPDVVNDHRHAHVDDALEQLRLRVHVDADLQMPAVRPDALRDGLDLRDRRTGAYSAFTREPREPARCQSSMSFSGVSARTTATPRSHAWCSRSMSTKSE